MASGLISATGAFFSSSSGSELAFSLEDTLDSGKIVSREHFGKIYELTSLNFEK